MNSVTVSGLYEFLHGDIYATVELSRNGDGYVAEFFCSRNILETYELRLLGCVRIPVFGESVDDAVRRISFIYEDVLDSIVSWSGGAGIAGSGGNVSSARLHCKSHLQTWGSKLTGIDKTERIATLYTFAVECGVSNPATLIAEVEVVGVRSIHDRIAYARRIGILDSYGKGRIKNGNRNEEQELWEEDRDYYASDEDGSQRERDASIIRRILGRGSGSGSGSSD